jgi:hypothetical protein
VCENASRVEIGALRIRALLPLTARRVDFILPTLVMELLESTLPTSEACAGGGGCLVTVLQAIDLAENCFLSEVLLWLGVKRLPLAMNGVEGDEFRFSDENDVTTSELKQQEISEIECNLAGLPPNPVCMSLKNDTYRSNVEFYDKMLKHDLSDEHLEKLKAERGEAIELASSMAEWQARYDEYMAYH